MSQTPCFRIPITSIDAPSGEPRHGGASAGFDCASHLLRILPRAHCRDILLPLARSEVLRFERHPHALEDTLLAGGYPRIFDRQLDPSEWLGAYVATYLERDVRSISIIGDLATFQRFVELCAGRTGQIITYSSLAADCGISQPTAKAWLGVLEASFIAIRLPALHSNLRKRWSGRPPTHGDTMRQ